MDLDLFATVNHIEPQTFWASNWAMAAHAHLDQTCGPVTVGFAAVAAGSNCSRLISNLSQIVNSAQAAAATSPGTYAILFYRSRDESKPHA